jgi:hypothetical protein
MSPDQPPDPAADGRPRSAGAILWLVVLIPLATVVAGISTVVLSVRSGSTDAVIDPVTRTAQVQDRDLRGDRQALERGLSARGRIDPDTGAVRLQLGGHGDGDGVGTLTLTLAHPTRGSLDARIDLVAAGDGAWLGRLDVDRSHDWNLLLTGSPSQWRLVGRLDANAGSFSLAPALSAP